MTGQVLMSMTAALTGQVLMCMGIGQAIILKTLEPFVSH